MKAMRTEAGAIRWATHAGMAVTYVFRPWEARHARWEARVYECGKVAHSDHDATLLGAANKLRAILKEAGEPRR